MKSSPSCVCSFHPSRAFSSQKSIHARPRYDCPLYVIVRNSPDSSIGTQA